MARPDGVSRPVARVAARIERGVIAAAAATFDAVAHERREVDRVREQNDHDNKAGAETPGTQGDALGGFKAL
eukprot:4492089-Pleurochrysis_carterae.AAC.1